MTTQQTGWSRPCIRQLVVLFITFASALLIVTPVESKSKSSKSRDTNGEETSAPINASEKVSTSNQRVVSLTFKQMGAWSALRLRGVDGSRTLSFSIRADEVVVGAKLRIGYDYSPALIPELSHLKILLNDRIATVEPLPREKGLANTRDIDLDPRLFGDSNNLTFTLIGHYSRQCEDPMHSSLWLTLSDLGRIELTLAPLTVASDLKNLPAPFFDRRDNVQLNLPFVFGSTPSFGTIKAAGVVSSWFGLLAGERGAQFPVSFKTIPDGNAVVFMQANDTIPGVKMSAGSSISIQPHPTNKNAKLLVISGTNEEELARAARAITLTNPALTGQLVNITKEVEVAPRKPYDAPAWIPTDRPVRIGELARTEELQVQGYFPETIRVNYRVSPDMFSWNSPGVPFKLKYRVTNLPDHKNSSLNVNSNNSFIRAMPLNVSDQKSTLLDTISLTGIKKTFREDMLFLPAYAVSGRNQLQLNYYFDLIKQGECASLPPENLQASIDPESTIDFSTFPHYAVLPNLSYFSTIGFPFTRMADLSETAVVLPNQPNSDELGVYLAIMGRMGEATGYPALRHSLTSAADVNTMTDRDLIVIGSAKSQSLMTLWADHLPVANINGARRINETHTRRSWAYRWEPQSMKASAEGDSSMDFTGNGDLTALMGIESPLKSARSVVVVYADKASDLRKISDVLTDISRIPSIQGDFSVIDDRRVQAVKVGDIYYVGSLPWATKLQWFFAGRPLLLAFVAILFCLLTAVIAYRSLRSLSTRRNEKKPLS